MWGGRKSIALLEGSQASSASSSAKSRVNMKTLGWLEAVDRRNGILISESMFTYNLEK
jgi:hypothetical protein